MTRCALIDFWSEVDILPKFFLFYKYSFYFCITNRVFLLLFNLFNEVWLAQICVYIYKAGGFKDLQHFLVSQVGPWRALWLCRAPGLKQSKQTLNQNSHYRNIWHLMFLKYMTQLKEMSSDIQFCLMSCFKTDVIIYYFGTCILCGLWSTTSSKSQH